MEQVSVLEGVTLFLSKWVTWYFLWVYLFVLPCVFKKCSLWEVLFFIFLLCVCTSFLNKKKRNIIDKKKFRSLEFQKLFLSLCQEGDFRAAKFLKFSTPLTRPEKEIKAHEYMNCKSYTSCALTVKVTCYFFQCSFSLVCLRWVESKCAREDGVNAKLEGQLRSSKFKNKF